MLKKGAQIIVECLLEQKVDKVFGYPGNNIISVYDALFECKDKIKHYLPTHEQYAIHAADGYARATGKPGVVIATSGPGATNLTTGIAAAYMDSVPLVIITGNVALSSLGKDSFQEVDTAGITMPITKYSVIVKDVRNIASTIREAFNIAMSGRKGPVLVDIPADIQAMECEFENAPLENPDKNNIYTKEDILAAASLINESKRPFIIYGGGVVSSDAAIEAECFAEKINAPVSLTLMGIGVFDTDDIKYCGLLGMNESEKSKKAMEKCDLIIAVGTRFADRVTDKGSGVSQNARILHIDTDMAEIGKNVPYDLYICGNAKDILAELAEYTDKKDESFINTLKNFDSVQNADDDGEMLSKKLLGRISQDIEEAIFTTDVGNHQMWAAKYLDKVKTREFITSGGLGAMGFGLGAAIGASIGTGKKVINISGDGSFHMNAMEISTAVKYDLPVVDIVFNNKKLGMVYDIQKNNNKIYCTELENKTDIKMLSGALGADYILVSKENTEDAVKAIKEAKRPLVCEVII